jgi:signal peptidase II
MKGSISNFKQFLGLALPTTVILLLGDRVTKYVSPTYFDDPYVLVPGFLELSFLGNQNFIFYWQFPIWIVFAVISVVLVLLGWQLVTALQTKDYLSALLLSIVFVGAGSNLYDRIAYGYVIDFVRVPFWSVFNLADIYIIGGVLALVFLVWHNERQERVAGVTRDEKE